MVWEKVKLGDICAWVASGGTPLTSKADYYSPKEIPWLKTQEVNYCRIYETNNQISKKGLENSSAKLIPANAVIVAMYGQGDTAGRVAINKIPLCTNQACCNLVIDENKADYEFVYYNLCTLYDKLVSLKNGGAQPNLNAGLIKNLEISLPPLSTQKRIADILSAYDNLIENNQKQIKLLEEAAQRLYKQWFIDLRYPGHETTKIVDGLPEGWRKGCLADIVRDVGINEKKENRTNYSYYLPIDCLPKKSLTYTDFNNIELAESSLVAFSENDIVFGAMRPYFHKVVVARDPGLTRSTCFVINTLKQSMWSYAVMLLFDAETIKYATKISVGTTMPYVRWKDFISMPILIPHENVTKDFNRIICPIIDRLKKISKQNIYLKQSRNRLLPKLMNGEIEV